MKKVGYYFPQILKVNKGEFMDPIIYVIDYILMAAVIVGSAIMALEAKEIVHAIFFFDVLTIAVGGMFMLFNAAYVAMFQLAVYAGAVSVVVLFAVMLTRRQKTGDEIISRAAWKTRIASIGLVVIIAAIMILLISMYTWPELTDYDYSSGGTLYQFITESYLAVFLGIGLLLATALIGGVALMRGRKTEQEVAS